MKKSTKIGAISKPFMVSRASSNRFKTIARSVRELATKTGSISSVLMDICERAKQPSSAARILENDASIKRLEHSIWEIESNLGGIQIELERAAEDLPLLISLLEDIYSQALAVQQSLVCQDHEQRPKHFSLESLVKGTLKFPPIN
jgi:hypothetical protein